MLSATGIQKFMSTYFKRLPAIWYLLATKEKQLSRATKIKGAEIYLQYGLETFKSNSR